MVFMKYEQRYDDLPFHIQIGVPHFLRCCDCGLVHKIVLKIPKVRKGTLISMTATRDMRKTAAGRRTGKWSVKSKS